MYPRHPGFELGLGVRSRYYACELLLYGPNLPLKIINSQKMADGNIPQRMKAALLTEVG